MSQAHDSEPATVWAAEHGASTRDLPSGADDGGANVGHRFRIHGRLQEKEKEKGSSEGASSAPEDPFAPRAAGGAASGQVTAELLRLLVARQSEIDARDVVFEVQEGEVTLLGTVGDEGEREQIEALLWRVPGVYSVRNQLRVHTA